MKNISNFKLVFYQLGINIDKQYVFKPSFIAL